MLGNARVRPEWAKRRILFCLCAVLGASVSMTGCDVENKADEAQTRAQAAQIQVGLAQGQIGDLRRDVSSMKVEIATLKEAVAQMEARNKPPLDAPKNKARTEGPPQLSQQQISQLSEQISQCVQGVRQQAPSDDYGHFWTKFDAFYNAGTGLVQNNAIYAGSMAPLYAFNKCMALHGVPLT